MLMLPDVKVYLSTQATDMRKSFDGLAQLVKQYMGKDVSIQRVIFSLFVIATERTLIVGILLFVQSIELVTFERLTLHDNF
jgi:hypothetical protein